ncbi:hypothetical protein [Desulfofustis limnaeus]|uniref:Phage tail assembly protein n=1 Tax=Desulfofustis limnaeus TaxID=2740163 RepID=A0ABM7WCY7_9BACT|nr:hypothetical protein [Desulfofustis limnaeus]BDD88869.1 hypothetical protein DPPLL_32340 [Desulfofustis limnaeus]
MRKAKIITIEGLGEVTVKEVSPLALYRAMNANDKVGETVSLLVDCISLPREKLEALYPSEIEQLVNAFVEVNSSFLAIADKLGLKDVLVALGATAVKTLPQLFADSYKEVMDRQPGTTAGAVS